MFGEFALVLPQMKKPGLNLHMYMYISFENFRLVFSLAFVLKLTESAIYNQINSHMSTHNLIPYKTVSLRITVLRVKNAGHINEHE